jgi:hypothetical protein
MNAAHIHLIVNHVPVLGVPFLTLLLLVAYAARSDPMARTALWGFALLGVFVIAVFLTGRAAEHVVKDLAGVTPGSIEAHEDWATASTIATAALGAFAVFVLVGARGGAIPRRRSAIVIAAGVVLVCVLAWTAELGARIRHSEIRPATESGVPANITSVDPLNPEHRTPSTEP